MGFFGFGKKHQTTPAVIAPEASDTMAHVKGVGRHQQILAGLPRRVQVELMPWEQGDAITAKINGERVGELDYSGPLHTVLAALRKRGLPPVIVDGEIRRGDIVPLYLAVALPSVEDVRALLPSDWAPALTHINVGMTSRYQDELALVYNIKQNRVAEVTFRSHEGGKADGLREGVVTLDGHVIGELAPANQKLQWAIIDSDQQNGILGRLLVETVKSHNAAKNVDEFGVRATYKRPETPASLPVRGESARPQPEA
jgi:hypothetical protein